MKTNITAKAIEIISVALFGLSTMASAQGQKLCSNATSAGRWGFTTTGTLILPTGSVPLAAVGAYTADPVGNIQGSQTRSVGGVVAHETFKGTITTNPDCTATEVVNVFDDSGALVRISTIDGVVDDNQTAARAIFKSLVLPDGTSLPVVLSIEAKKMFPKD
jgi:hypothetical protein